MAWGRWIGPVGVRSRGRMRRGHVAQAGGRGPVGWSVDAFAGADATSVTQYDTTVECDAGGVTIAELGRVGPCTVSLGMSAVAPTTW